MKMPIPSWLLRVHMAVTFLTRLPLPPVDYDPQDDLARSMSMFPVAGLLVGAVGGAVFWGLSHVVPALAAAVLAVTAQIIVTGALHEDGLADLADGLGARGDMVARLAAMRDSHVGSFGVLALILAVLLRVVLVASAPSGWAAMAALLAGAALSRAAMPAIMQIMPPARTDGLGAGAGVPDFSTVAFGLAIALNAMLLTVGFAASVAGLALAIPVVLAVRFVCMRCIGGFTGDVLGAVQQLTELAVLLGVASQW